VEAAGQRRRRGDGGEGLTASGGSWFGGLAVSVDARAVSDARGTLWAVDFADGVPVDPPFAAVRAFVVSAPDGTVRGEHGHVDGRQLLMRVAGEIRVDMAHGEETATTLLTAEAPAILISAPVWARQTYLGPAPAMVVFCDTPYRAESYVTERPGTGGDGDG